MKGLIVDARYGLFTLTGTDLDTDSNSGFQIPWATYAEMFILHGVRFQS